MWYSCGIPAECSDCGVQGIQLSGYPATLVSQCAEYVHVFLSRRGLQQEIKRMYSGRVYQMLKRRNPLECAAIILRSRATGKKVPAQFEAGCRFPQRHDH